MQCIINNASLELCSLATVRDARMHNYFRGIRVWIKKKLYLCTQKLTMQDMSKYEIPFLTACIRAFGRRFSMTRQAAFRYLHEHKGLAFLIEFYDVEHLQSMDETIEDLLIICQKNGGTLA